MIHYLELVEHIIDEQTSGIGLKNILIVVFVSIVVVLIPGLMISKKKKQVETRRVLLYFFLFFYLGIMFLIALFRRKPVIDDYNIVTYFDFGAFGNGIFKLRQTIYNLLNILFFVPLGIMLYLIRSKEVFLKSLIMTMLTGFLISFFVECSQLITKRGLFEITDILMNMVGTFWGAMISVLVLYQNKKRNEKK